MKLCRFDEDRLGVVVGDTIHDITPIQDEIRAKARYDMKGDAVIAALPEYRAKMEEAARTAPTKKVSEVSLLPPIARPCKVMAAPINYQAHIEEMAAQPHVTGADKVQRPTGIQNQGIFLKANSALVGPGEGVAIRFPDRRNDHEVEFVIVIGKQGSRIKRENALDYIAGYTLGLDMTVRGPEDRSARKSCNCDLIGEMSVTVREAE